MSQNTHKGMTGHRRPVNQKNGAEKRAKTQAVLDFLRSRDTKESK
ncbi:hypothetical protein LCR01_15960 [Companilactobacillus crustorum]|jgi:hypothetical protein|uniref:Uncharacterized protein n=1 Tax=Companilactobacillus crustorum TaxID=392416 RepID=A0AB34AE58_9LACO|nr:MULTISPECIES: hypothetical protein [Companilactobacillus]APU70525.1 hypothetical protein BI355_0168 [Companilactobacillus crustorum]WDT65320.1 hypothetical protein NV391_10165 [Companilactobacillus crustorum]GEO77153.1 hypothetical protein LCR01_15960 [Companilactobacillus crustorum]